MTASSVASAKVDRVELEALARALRVELRVDESGAALFRRCLERAQLLATSETLDRLEQREQRNGVARVRMAVVEAEGNAGALEALRTFNAALGGLRGDGTEEAAAEEAPPSSAR